MKNRSPGIGSWVGNIHPAAAEHISEQKHYMQHSLPLRDMGEIVVQAFQRAAANSQELYKVHLGYAHYFKYTLAGPNRIFHRQRVEGFASISPST